MRLRLTTTLTVLIPVALALGGCALFGGPRHYTIYFEPYSADPGSVARATLHDAADYARGHPWMKVVVAGFAAPADPGRNIDGLSAQRAATVVRVLTTEGVGEGRITSKAEGIVDPNNLPSVAVRRVDITVGE